MVRKITAILLLATALPALQASANSGRPAPVNDYQYFMITLGGLYFLFLLVRMFKRSHK
jgi:hypothetical protein